MKRLLDCYSSDIKKASKQEKIEAIKASAGRILASEITLYGAPDIGITVAELNASFGADMLLFNILDVYEPKIPGLPATMNDMPALAAIKALTGRITGINLEPVDENSDVLCEREKLPDGRIASEKTSIMAMELGADFILLTGNPGSGVTNEKIYKTLESIFQAVGNDMLLFAGKMHSAGTRVVTSSDIISQKDIDMFISAGADVILVPAPGTVPGITMEYIKDCIEYCHRNNKLAMTAIGTSQEDSDMETIRRIANMCIMAGTDIHHIGDAGYAGLVPESIMAYSIAIRGKRHTYRRMAGSPLR